jgi:hypothetical protein
MRSMLRIRNAFGSTVQSLCSCVATRRQAKATRGATGRPAEKINAVGTAKLQVFVQQFRYRFRHLNESAAVGASNGDTPDRNFCPPVTCCDFN